MSSPQPNVNELKMPLDGSFLAGDCFTAVRWEGSSMEWRKIIGSPFCDLPPGHKHVLTTLARYGDKWGDDIFPSQREIAVRAGVSPKCVNQTVQRAEKEGWINRHFVGGGRGYKRSIYELSIPAGVFDATAFYKKKFWEPPFRYRILKQDNSLVMVELSPT